MTVYVGLIDRILRGALGLGLLCFAFLGGLQALASPLYYYGAMVVSGILLLTAIIQKCPVYSFVGIKSGRP